MRLGRYTKTTEEPAPDLMPLIKVPETEREPVKVPDEERVMVPVKRASS